MSYVSEEEIMPTGSAYRTRDSKFNKRDGSSDKENLKVDFADYDNFMGKAKISLSDVPFDDAADEQHNHRRAFADRSNSLLDEHSRPPRPPRAATAKNSTVPYTLQRALSTLHLLNTAVLSLCVCVCPFLSVCHAPYFAFLSICRAPLICGTRCSLSLSPCVYPFYRAHSERASERRCAASSLRALCPESAAPSAVTATS